MTTRSQRPTAAVRAGASAIQRVRGTNDFLPPADARLRGLEHALRAGFEPFGYEGIQTPILEPLELFLRKSGDEIASRMYAFSHWNRRLCLRPEFTASVMRAYVSELQGRALPVRLHYGGPTFRYEKPQRGRYRQFTEVGLELIGGAGAAADAEVLHLACAGLGQVGVSEYRLVVGHVGAVLELLRQLGLSEHAQGLVLDYMEPLVRGRVELETAVSRIVDLLGGAGAEASAVSELPPELAGLPPEEATTIAEDILRRARLPVEGGAREPQHIIQRLLAKANRTDPTDSVRTALEFVLELHGVAGPRERLSDLRALLADRGLSTTPLDEVEAALAYLDLHGARPAAACLEVDLSLARGLRYYTGLVFEIYVGTADGPLQVCGGGRYDDLVRALGGRESVPACGFSYGLERLDLVQAAVEAEAPRRPRVLVAPVTPDDLGDALTLARELRIEPGIVVEQDVRLRGPKAALRYADRSDVDAVVLVGESERADGTAVVRLMRSREEHRVARADVAALVREVRP